MAGYTLAEIAELLNAELHGDADCRVESLATLAGAQSGQISFLANKKYRSQLASTEASCVLLSPADLKYCETNALVLDNPYLGYALLAQHLDNTPAVARSGIAPSASVHELATLGGSVAIGHNVVIEAGAVIGDGCQIGPGCFIGAGCQLGSGTVLHANVTLYHGVTLGESCVVHSGSIIGADGFGYANDKGRWVKIPQLGSVVIGDGTEIGANTTIDRGALEDTCIGRGVIIDNQCQIGHNCVIGDYTAIAGAAGVAGSTKIGKYCVIGGGVGINGHIELCDGVHLTGMTMVTKSITEPGVYSSGIPATGNREWRRGVSRYSQLDDMHKRLKSLEARLEQLDSTD